jgi:gamma-glutamylcyclotransferase
MVHSFIRYFAYGSNMSMRRLRERVPQAQPLGSAILHGHELRFHKRGRDGSGKCDAYCVNDETAYLIGVLFDIPLAGKDGLDRIEGLGAGYHEKTVSVLRENGAWDAAVTYYATDISKNLLPYCWYKRHVLTGAMEFNFPKDYLESIEAVAMVADQDSRRKARENALYA